MVQVSAVVHTGQRGQVFSRVSTNCRVGFFNSDIDTYEGFVYKPPNFKLETNWLKTPFCIEQRSRFLKYNTQNGTVSTFSKNIVYSFITSVSKLRNPTAEQLAACWWEVVLGDIKHSIFQFLLWLCSCCGL